MRKFLKRNLKRIRLIKIIIASLLSLMVIIDIVLVRLVNTGTPTFSRLIASKRESLIWLTFLLGGLISKIFFNRIVQTKSREISGFFTFMAMVILLFAFGQIENIEISTSYQLLIMVCGGILAHRAWPQYKWK